MNFTAILIQIGKLMLIPIETVLSFFFGCNVQVQTDFFDKLGFFHRINLPRNHEQTYLFF